MKKITNTGSFILILLASLVLHLSSCESDDYINDGGTADAHVNMSTYDFLASNPKFDSLVAIIDRAGMKDLVNSDITFFASTNYSVVNYVAAKKQKKIIETGNENISFGISNISVAELDSLKIYMFGGAINRDQMVTAGRYYTSKFGNIPNNRFMIKLRRTNDYSSYLDFVDYVNFTKVIGTLDSDEPQGTVIPSGLADQSYDCQTSGIITTTGIIHVLADNHRLMFNNERIGSN
ncbi:hypothetical protein [Arcticibacter tournemirensis]|uniref:FAS1 domain-containing protein n=1 Tax=Arcticibacter tournemirensis TaxID=699437 RepID=A0A4V1KIZ6_9SPHI|nr:hypothetical protein [Arcticibacter tournemirensis]RXF72422.1 hypothetical protein EKH83_01465 [Arcticibacter tournemirensis]